MIKYSLKALKWTNLIGIFISTKYFFNISCSHLQYFRNYDCFRTKYLWQLTRIFYSVFRNSTNTIEIALRSKTVPHLVLLVLLHCFTNILVNYFNNQKMVGTVCCYRVSHLRISKPSYFVNRRDIKREKYYIGFFLDFSYSVECRQYS